MTNPNEPPLPPRTMRIGKIISERMPHLTFAIWDLSEFMPAFHNVRRNMAFVECEELARAEVMNVLAGSEEFGKCIIYSGERKPKSVNEDWTMAKSDEIRDVIVIIATKGPKEGDKLEGNSRIPPIEYRLIDMLYYSLKGMLPITVEEANHALMWCLRTNNTIKITKLQRYAVRRYLGWFLDILLYRLSSNEQISTSVDPRYLDYGKRYYEAVMKVDSV